MPRLALPYLAASEPPSGRRRTSTVRQPGKQLLVRADAGVNYGKVMQAMGLIRAAGITDVGLVTLSADSSATAAPAMPLP